VRSRIEVVIEVVERQVQLPQFQIVGEVAEVRRMLADHTVLGRHAVETSALQCPPGGGAFRNRQAAGCATGDLERRRAAGAAAGVPAALLGQ